MEAPGVLGFAFEQANKQYKIMTCSLENKSEERRESTLQKGHILIGIRLKKTCVSGGTFLV